MAPEPSRDETSASAGRAAAVEWVAAAVAGLVVLWIVASLLGEALRGADSAPDLVMTLEETIEGAATQQRFRLSNRGGEAASAVVVALRLGAGAGATERRLTVDYVAGGSEVTGGFFLAPDEIGLPRSGRVDGYIDP